MSELRAQNHKFHGHGRWIQLRHLPILGHRVYIRFRPKQYKCPHCGDKITTQTLDWCEPKSPHTKAYDRHLMLQLISSTVEDVRRKEEVGYDAVEGAIKRCLQATVNWDEFDELNLIGIDEVALTKGRKNFVAIVTTQQADGHVAALAVLPDRKKKTVRQFLETIPQRLRPTMEMACTDMWEGHTHAVQEFAAAHPEVCIEVVVKGTMWIIRKNNRDLTADERERLRRLFELSPKLKLAYTFREELTAIFEMQLTPEEAKKRLLKWMDKVRRSGLTCFDKFLTTLNNWLAEIVDYFANRLSSGFVEGLNNKVKTIKRRCYGILPLDAGTARVTTLFQCLYLDLEGYRRFA